MIKQVFNVRNYWKVVVLYNLDCNLFNVVSAELEDIGFSDSQIDDVLYNMCKGDALAVTCSNISRHRSVILFNRHTSKRDYINSIVHEAEHVKQAMLKAYKVEDSGESPAYTIGYLVMRMYNVFREFLQ